MKIPKWQFEKFPGADTTLGTQMKSVGEVMAIGRTFKEALQKGIRSLEPQYALARAGGNAGFAAARKTGHAAAGSHSLAADRAGARTARRRNLRADENRSVVHPADGGNHRDESPGRARDGRNGFGGIAARSQAQRHERRATGANVEDHAGRGALQRARYGVTPGFQARGYLRGGIRIVHAVHVFDVRGRRRIRRRRPSRRS